MATLPSLRPISLRPISLRPISLRSIVRGLAALTVAALLSAAVGACATSRGAAPDAVGPEDVTMAELWRSLQADLMDGRSHSAEARARELFVLQEIRCRELRASVLDSAGGASSALDTSALARCEDALQEYRTLARLSDLDPHLGR